MRSARISLAVVLAALALPTGAVAQSSPFTPLPSPAPAQEQTPTVTTASSTSGGGGLSTGTELLLFAGGVLLIVAIGYAIWRDARRRAPTLAGQTGFEETKTTPHAKKKQNRARDKRARAARKRNRH